MGFSVAARGPQNDIYFLILGPPAGTLPRKQACGGHKAHLSPSGDNDTATNVANPRQILAVWGEIGILIFFCFNCD